MSEHTPRKNAEARLETLRTEISHLKTAMSDLEGRNDEAHVEISQMMEAGT